MEPMKLNVFFAFFAYGGNGGIAMQLPEITFWFADLVLQLRDDPRISHIARKRFGDVPLTMERNMAVKVAKQHQADVLVMIDSDNVPDLYYGADPEAKHFFWSSFDFLYERKLRNLPSVVVAPYCGPPPHPIKGGQENVYVFYAEANENNNLDTGFSFESYSRQEASMLKGIHPIAAGPTGCVMYSVDAFDLMPVRTKSQEEILDEFKSGTISRTRCLQLMNMQSWFFYEFNTDHTEKRSTEDVTNTRELQLAGITKYDEPIVFCNWDSWAGHYKPKCVGKPNPVRMDEVNSLYREAVERECVGERLVNLKANLEFMEPDEMEQSAEEPIGNSSIIVEQVSRTLEQEPSNNGHEIVYRRIGGRRVKCIVNRTPEEDLNAVATIVNTCASRFAHRPLRIVEVGTWVGESALAMHAAMGQAGGTITCVDTWEGTPTDGTRRVLEDMGAETIYDTFKENVGQLLDASIKVIKGRSLKVARSFETPQNVDMVFLDASHDYENVKADIHAWFPHINDDGVLCGHDLTDSFPGVWKAVKEFCDDGGIMPNFVAGTQVWMVHKRHWIEGAQRKQRQLEADQEDVDEREPIEADSSG